MVSEEFKKNVETGDADTVRSALIDYLIIDPTSRKFDEALAYAENNMDIIEPDNGQQEYILEEDSWNIDYLNSQKVALMVNFSKERISHIKKVVQAVLSPNNRDLDAMADSPISDTTITGKRTGRTVLSEKTVSEHDIKKHSTNDRTARKASPPNSKIGLSSSNQETMVSRTGRRVISENTASIMRIEEEVHPIDYATWMIGGGIAVAALGGVTAGVGAALTNSTLIHTGLAVAGTGSVIAMSGGIIKVVKER